jgi:hypothetical protein
MSSSTSTNSNNNGSATDITVYGATSFVAKHVLKYLITASEKHLSATTNKNEKLRITLGGRNKEKLENVKDSFKDKSFVDIYVADGSDLESLQKMAKRSKVILNCAGPYALYSSLVVGACAEVGCDYVDITGEVAWVATMREKYGKAAKASGARIISLCGYDSIPTDMAVFCAVQAVRKGVMTSAEQTSKVSVQVGNARIWHQAFGIPNGGTIHTFCEIPYNPMDDFFVSIDTNDKNNNSKTIRPMPYFVGDPLLLSNPERVKNNPSYQITKNTMAKGEWMNQMLLLEPEFFYGVSLPFAMGAVNL